MTKNPREKNNGTLFFLPGVMEEQYMAAHGKLNHINPLLVLLLILGVFQVEADELVVFLVEPCLVHVDDAMDFGGVVGVDRHDLVSTMNRDVEGVGELLVIIEDHGDAAGKMHCRAEKARRQGKIGERLCVNLRR